MADLVLRNQVVHEQSLQLKLRSVSLGHTLRVLAFSLSPAGFFHFDKDERNEKALRKKIEGLLQKSDPEQLQRVQQLLKTLLEP